MVQHQPGWVIPCTLHLAAGSFNSLLEKMRKEAISRSWVLSNEVVGMFNENYPLCLGGLYKGGVESTVSTFFDHR